MYRTTVRLDVGERRLVQQYLMVENDVIVRSKPHFGDGNGHDVHTLSRQKLIANNGSFFKKIVIRNIRHRMGLAIIPWHAAYDRKYSRLRQRALTLPSEAAGGR